MINLNFCFLSKNMKFLIYENIINLNSDQAQILLDYIFKMNLDFLFDYI